MQTLTQEINVVLWAISYEEVDVTAHDLEAEYMRGLQRLSEAQSKGIVFNYTPQALDELDEDLQDVREWHIVSNEHSWHYKFEI